MAERVDSTPASKVRRVNRRKVGGATDRRLGRAIPTSDMPPPSLKASSEPRRMELIGVDRDGNMSLWDTGMVQPISKFEGNYSIKPGHYVIEWRGHAITVHCESSADGWVAVLFMCSDQPSVRMHRLEIEAMLLGKVIPDPVVEAQISEGLRRLAEGLAARNAPSHRQRGRI